MCQNSIFASLRSARVNHECCSTDRTHSLEYNGKNNYNFQKKINQRQNLKKNRRAKKNYQAREIRERVNRGDRRPQLRSGIPRYLEGIWLLTDKTDFLFRSEATPSAFASTNSNLEKAFLETQVQDLRNRSLDLLQTVASLRQTLGAPSTLWQLNPAAFFSLASGPSIVLSILNANYYQAHYLPPIL